VLVVALFAQHWLLGVIALLALPLLAGVLALTAAMSRRADDAFHRSFADASQRVVEFAQAQSVLRAFNGDGGGLRLLEQAVERQRQAGARLIWLSAGSAVLNAWAAQAAFAAMLMAAVWWANDLAGGPLAPGAAAAVIVSLVLAARYVDALLEVAGYGEVLRGARGQLDAIAAL
ncbi:hypothetical protein LZB68_09755, partial [Campylobacter lari]|nr:hypothetical protein [Campylobacter lari]